MAKSNEVKVIEFNLPASRSFRLVSKVLGVNFACEAMRRMLGLGTDSSEFLKESKTQLRCNPIHVFSRTLFQRFFEDLGSFHNLSVNVLDLGYVGVNVAMFSFGQFHGAGPLLGVEMASTGEVDCLAGSFHGARSSACSRPDSAYRAPAPFCRRVRRPRSSLSPTRCW